MMRGCGFRDSIVKANRTLPKICEWGDFPQPAAYEQAKPGVHAVEIDLFVPLQRGVTALDVTGEVAVHKDDVVVSAANA